MLPVDRADERPDTLGLDHDRPLTVTGGLGFAGPPVANARSGQSIAAIVPLVHGGGVSFVHGIPMGASRPSMRSACTRTSRRSSSVPAVLPTIWSSTTSGDRWMTDGRAR